MNMDYLKLFVRKIVAMNFSDRDSFDSYIKKHPRTNIYKHTINQMPADDVIKKTEVFDRYDKVGVKRLVTPLLYKYVDSGIFDYYHILAVRRFRKEYGRSDSIDQTVDDYKYWLKNNKDKYKYLKRVYNESLIVPSKYLQYLLLAVKDPL